MSHQNENDSDPGEDDPKTYRDYKRAKNDRLKDPEDAGPRDPAEGFEGVGEDIGFEDVLEGDGDVSKSTQAEMKDALADADFYGINGVRRAKDDTDSVDLSWSREDFEGDPTEADLLAEIRDELARMNADDRERALKSLADTGAGQRWVGLLDAEGTDESTADAVATLERLEERLAAEEQAEMLEGLLNAYVEASPENGLEDPLRDLKEWLREQAEDMDPEERGRVMDTLDRLETATDASGAGAAD
jgi:hypothetical protein